MFLRERSRQGTDKIIPSPPENPIPSVGGGGNAYFLDRTLAFAKMLILESLKVYTKV